MGGLIRLFSVSLLCGCISTDCDYDRFFATENYEYVRHISLFRNKIEAQSRAAAVKVTAYDMFGNKIGGSGAYITHNGKHYILTAAHVVEGSSIAMVDGTREIIIADVVYVDRDSDLALLSIAGMASRKPIPWKVSKEIDVGSKLVYSGYPNMLSLLTIKGEIAGFYKQSIVAHSYVWRGASGSVVLDSKGDIVGVVSAVDMGTDFDDYLTIIEDVGITAPVYSLEDYFKKKQ